MTQPLDDPWREPFQGLRLTERALCVEADDQALLLRLCGLDPSTHGSQVDPAAFIKLAILEGVRNRVRIHGAVHLSERVVQHRPVALGERVTVSGEILDLQAVARGTLVISETVFRGDDGQRAVTISRHSLRPGPDMAAVRGAGDKPTAIIGEPARLTRLATITLIPEAVAAFAGPENPIHFDPELARQNGYRAPIAGGAFCARFLTAEIWRRFAPHTLSLDIRFRRPVFWDDTVDVVVDEHDGRWRAIGLAVRGKVSTEARIDGLTVDGITAGAVTW